MRRATAGFTLVEMIVTISVVAIMASIGAASYTSAMASTRMSGEINVLLGSLSLARSEAIKRGQSTSVCPQSGAVCGTGTSWASGWYVMLNATTQPLQITPGVTHGDTLVSSLSTYPQFTPAGYTFFTGTLSLHDSNSTPGLYRCIVFNAGSWTTQQGSSCP
jgi:type IV fimbrial biogenesis protein FimT